MKDKKTIVGVSTLLCLIALYFGTYAYYKQKVNGTLIGHTGEIAFNVKYKDNTFTSVNLADTTDSEAIEGKINPGDSGEFTLVADATGSTENVAYSIVFRGENVPTNMIFFVDDQKVDLKNYVLINKIDYGSSMTKTHTIKWKWPYFGEYDDDADFMNKNITINVEATGRQAGNDLLTTIKNKAVLDNINSTYVNNTTPGIDLALAPSNTNGKGVYILNGTENNTYPIYYYRGNVNDNNLIYANYCWKIVRTTETGGIKIVYNGVPTNGKCSNTGTNSQLQTQSAFNSVSSSITYTSLTSVGYMYGDKILIAEREKYKTHLEDLGTSKYTETLAGSSITRTRHNQNAYSSAVKNIVDTWYKENILTNFSGMLEDTIWCNDRALSTGTYSIDNFDSNTYFAYAGRDRLVTSTTPSLTCSRDMDKFTVSKSNGNGDLEYPVGLLTADEITYAGVGWFGYSSDSYLATGSRFWVMTPARFVKESNDQHVFDYNAERLGNGGVSNAYGVRPSVSLKNGVDILSGNGTENNPYIVKP